MRRWNNWLRPPRSYRTKRGVINLSPPQVLALAFAGLVLIGTLLLKLPWATRLPVGWLDALFTATSAVTVTGLTVVDTGSTYSLFGQVVLLVLMQLGGVGFMSFAVLILQALGGRITLREQIVLREALNHTSLSDLTRLVRIVLIIALAMEGLGMLVLATHWVPELGLREGLYFSLFHAISAFNSAGFSLRADSMAGYAGTPVITLTLGILFIAGGLGVAVFGDLYRSRRFHDLSLHSKLMLTWTPVMILVPWVIILLLEWNNPATLGALPQWGDRILAGWFQAATPRSAGFSTLDIGALQPATVTMMTGLMFVGGGSASTAGGIKLTTFIILVLATRAFLRQEEEPVIFGRSIGQETVLKALAITLMSLMWVSLMVFLLTISETGHDFQDLLFEAMSGFATVGLSRGVTPELSEFGKALMALSMFIGRLGPLSLAFILTTRRRARVRYAQGDVYIG